MAELSNRDLNIVLDSRNSQLEQLAEQCKRYRNILEELLDTAERIRGGDPNLNPEQWYAIRDAARVELKNTE